MKSCWFLNAVIILFVISGNQFLLGSGQTGLPEYIGPYLGATPPSTRSEEFRPKLFSFGESVLDLNLHSSLYFTKDGKELFFTNQKLPYEPGRSETILYMSLNNGIWTQPAPAPFSSEYSDQTGWFSPDGHRFYFGSIRPMHEDSAISSNLRWWVVEKEPEQWSQPRYILSPMDITWDDGPFYIFLPDADTSNSIDIFRTDYATNHYTTPQNIGHPPNSKYEDYPVLVGPDETYLIIYRSDPFDRNSSGLFISYNENSTWTEPKRMGDEIGSGFDASLSPDGKYLFYLTRKDGVYWVSSQIIDYLRTNNLNIVDSLYTISINGIDLLEKTLLELMDKHHLYFNFSEKCLESVFERLALESRIDKAYQIATVNENLFPSKTSVLAKLLCYTHKQHYDSIQILADKLIKENSIDTSIKEKKINQLGYVFMQAGRYEEAMQIFMLNVTLFPKSYNTYDSYAESLMKLDRIELAIHNYKKSLEINPQNQNAKNMLLKLGGL
jgi:hypothetical protein